MLLLKGEQFCWKAPNSLPPQPSNQSGLVSNLAFGCFTTTFQQRWRWSWKDKQKISWISRSSILKQFLLLSPQSVRGGEMGAGQMSHRFSKSVKLPFISDRVGSDVGGHSLIFFSFSPHHDTVFHLIHQLRFVFHSFHLLGHPLCWNADGIVTTPPHPSCPQS